MSDWKAVTDPNTGRIYYANLVTRETRWDPPPGFQDNQQPITYQPDNQVNYQNNFQQQQQQNNYQQSFYGNQQNQYQQQPQQSFYQPQPQQQSFYGNQQNQYQQQQQQQQSFYQQQPPQQSFYQPQQQQQQQVDDSNSDWKAAFDDNTGKYYYYNEKTGQTQWHMPEELKQQQKN